MSRSTIIRSTTRVGTTVATAGLAALLLAAPASARPDPGTGGRDFAPGERTGTTSGPVQNPGPTVTVDDNTAEYLQVGAGILAGLSLAGAGAALMSRRHGREVTPA